MPTKKSDIQHISRQKPQRFNKITPERLAWANRTRASGTLSGQHTARTAPLLIELQNVVMNCVEGSLDIDGILHPNADLALIQFKGYKKLLCDHFPMFAADDGSLKPGKLLCRLGYPFPEFTNFRYDKDADQIEWTTVGRDTTPRFPLEGMVTRNLLDAGNKTFGFELSTPGLKGQSGGPAFDSDGRIWGVQFATNHLDLDFDVNMDVIREGKKRPVKDYAFLRVGYAVHIDLVKDFMREHSIAFQEG